jgi:nitrite reductase/ring-hydroxylating ferredoxin subunit
MGEPVRITDLSAPPVVGRWYLVPTVRFGYMTDSAQDWPVFLPKQEDARFFEFKDVHYHPDPRFMSKALLRLTWGVDGDDKLAALQRMPLAKKRFGPWAIDPPEPIWRRRLCQSTDVSYQFGHNPKVVALREHFAGQHCKANRHGWVCPHQNWPMGSAAPDESGVLTCPLHGLRVRASDGLVLSDPAAERAREIHVELSGTIPHA